jgi:hypothetical protein
MSKTSLSRAANAASRRLRAGASGVLAAAALLLASMAAASAQAFTGLQPPLTHGCPAKNGGYLRARLRGASTLDIDWRGGQLQCEGDPRPDQHGLRMTFVGTVGPGDHHLRFVFGIDTRARAGEAHEVPTNLTLIFEGEGRLYATRGNGQCTIDWLRAQPLRASDRTRRLQIEARGFCIGPASALEDASVNTHGASAAGAAAGDALAGDQLLVTRFDFAGAVRLPATR